MNVFVKPISCFRKKLVELLVQLSHHHVCELLARLVETQTSCIVDETPELLQLLQWKTAQIQLCNSKRTTLHPSLSIEH